MKAIITQAKPGDLFTSASVNGNFSTFSGSLNGDNFSVDCFETYHINKTTALSPTLYSAGSVENGSYTTGTYAGTGVEQPITHGANALSIGAIVLPANSTLFVNWKQHIVGWDDNASTPENIKSFFFLTAEINSAASSSLISGVYWGVSGFNKENEGAAASYLYDTNPITVAGQVAYVNNTTSSQAVANLKVQIAPSYGIARNYTASLGQGNLSYYILRN